MQLLQPFRMGLCAIVLLGLFSCQKDASQESSNLLEKPSAAAKGGGGGTTPPPAYVFTLPTFGTACALDGMYCFDASFTNKGGNEPGGNNSITVSLWQTIDLVPTQVRTDEVKEGTSANFCFSELTAGQYTVKVYFRHAGSDNAAPVNVPLTFLLTVQNAETCGGGSVDCTADGVRLTRSSTVLETDAVGKAVNVTSNYIVTNCGTANLTKLKLQGGLVNKADLLSDPTAIGGATEVVYKKSQSNGNNILSWTFNLPAGATETFGISYSVWGTSCGGPLSGAWSLKNSAGIPIGVAAADASATQAGYLDRLFWVCQ